MSAAAARVPARRHYRRRRLFTEAGSAILGLILLIWTLLPIYNMFLIALDPEEGEVEFTGNIFPPEPSLDAFGVVLTQDDRYLAQFWQQFGNSLYIGVLTMVLTLVIASLASFAVGRMRLGKGRWLTGAALLTYAVPAALLAIPFYRAMHSYGLTDSPWAVIAAQVTLASPFAILILRHYATLIPVELDDAARIDGATGARRFVHVTFPLLANLYLVCTLLSTLWTVGDFNTVYFVSNGAPALSTDVLATLGFRYTFDGIKPELGLAAMMSALPVLIPIVIIMVRRLHTREVQL